MQALDKEARLFGLDLSPAQMEAFEIYYRELVDWNMRANLTGITNRDQVRVKHFLDSLSIAPLIDSPNASLIDIGSGAGFPGLPLKIAFPSLPITFLEATRKKVDFLQHMINRLSLDATALQARAEDLGRDPAHREKYDVAVARAVGEMALLAEYALPLVRVGGTFIAQKGIDVEAELDAARRALRQLGGQVREIRSVQLPGLAPRHLVVVSKNQPTPSMYPRRAGLPERKPLR